MKHLLTTTALLLSTFSLAQAQMECRDQAGKLKYKVFEDGYIASAENKSVVYTNIMDAQLNGYLKRLRQKLSAHGTTVVFVLVPKALDALTTTDPDLRTPEPEKMLKSYSDIVKSMEKSGAVVPDLLEELYAFMKANPKVHGQFDRDSHWSPEIMKATSEAIRDHLKAKAPKLLKEIGVSKNTLVVSGTFNRPGDKEQTAQKEYCKSLPLIGDTVKKYELKEDSVDLLGDVEIPVVLLGTSYSSNPPGLGFEMILSNVLQTRITNAAINGGGPFGGFLEYFAKEKVKYPKLLVWEFGAHQFDNKANPFSPTVFRMALPLVETKVELSKKEGTESTATAAVTGLTKASAADAVRIKLSSIKTRVLKVTLDYASGSETVTLNHSHGTNFSDYYFELKPGAGALKKVSFTVPDQKQIGGYSVSLVQYK